IIAAKSSQARYAARKAGADDVGAATDGARELENEICDLLYHLLVLMAERDVPLADVAAVLRERSAKTGNLKKFKTTDRNS
ncbi:MAG: hypothetical protein LBO81_06355, partial [Clostridiales Family XIII bacterium]|nr:hypothetical protein [Clostridiales Family XIII bacterium]